jgi:RNA polymerase sigma-70 factor (ECF subfamily)
MMVSVRNLARHVTKHELSGRRLQSSYVDPDDVTQEALLVFFERCHKIRDVEQLRSWFWTVMRLTISKLLGEFHRLVGIEGLAATEPRLLVVDCASEDPHAASQNQGYSEARVKALLEAVQKLSPRLQSVVKHHIFDGLNHNETAELLGIAPSAVRVRWHRAKRILHSRLADGAHPSSP